MAWSPFQQSYPYDIAPPLSSDGPRRAAQIPVLPDGVDGLPAVVQTAIKAYVFEHRAAFLPQPFALIALVAAAVRLNGSGDAPQMIEIATAKTCQTPEGFRRWLGQQPKVLKDFYWSSAVLVFDPLSIEPLTREHIIGEGLKDGQNLEPGRLTKALRGEVKIAGLLGLSPEDRLYLARALMSRAVELQSRPLPKGDGRPMKDPHIQARFLAWEVVNSKGQDWGRLLAGLPPGVFESFLQVFAGPLKNSEAVSDQAKAIGRILTALNSAALTKANKEAVGNAVETIWMQAGPSWLAKEPALIHQLALAMAYHWYLPDNPDAANEEAARLEGLVRTAPELLLGGSDWRKLAVLTALYQSRSITAETLERFEGEALQNPAVALALAQVLVPQDAPSRDMTVLRVAGIFGTPKGSGVFFGQEDVPLDAKLKVRGVIIGQDKVSLDAKLKLLAVIIGHPEITDHVFTHMGDDPWQDPVIAGAYAQAAMAPYRNDSYQELPGAALDNMIGLALNIPPKLPPGVDASAISLAAVNEALAKGEPLPDFMIKYNFYAKDEEVARVAKGVRDVSPFNPPRVCFLRVLHFNGKENGPVEVPLLRVDTGFEFGGYALVDNEGGAYKAHTDDSFGNIGRTYETAYEFWKDANSLPEGTYYIPEGAHLRIDDKTGALQLYHDGTPATKGVKKVLRRAAPPTAAASTAALTFFPPSAPVTGPLAVASGAYMVYDRWKELAHRRELGFAWSDPQVSALMRGIVVDLVSVLPGGGKLAAEGLAALGFMKIAAFTARAAPWLKKGAAALNFGIMVEQGVNMARDPKHVSWDEALSFVFYAAVGVHHARAGGGKPESLAPAEVVSGKETGKAFKGPKTDPVNPFWMYPPLPPIHGPAGPSDGTNDQTAKQAGPAVQPAVPAAPGTTAGPALGAGTSHPEGGATSARTTGLGSPPSAARPPVDAEGRDYRNGPGRTGRFSPTPPTGARPYDARTRGGGAGRRSGGGPTPPEDTPKPTEPKAKPSLPQADAKLTPQQKCDQALKAVETAKRFADDETLSDEAHEDARDDYHTKYMRTTRAIGNLPPEEQDAAWAKLKQISAGDPNKRVKTYNGAREAWLAAKRLVDDKTQARTPEQRRRDTEDYDNTRKRLITAIDNLLPGEDPGQKGNALREIERLAHEDVNNATDPEDLRRKRIRFTRAEHAVLEYDEEQKVQGSPTPPGGGKPAA
jgi:hypothetical protein